MYRRKNHSHYQNANLYPYNATNKDVVWESSNESVATVDEKGTITVIKEGKTIKDIQLQEKYKDLPAGETHRAAAHLQHQLLGREEKRKGGLRETHRTAGRQPDHRRPDEPRGVLHQEALRGERLQELRREHLHARGRHGRQPRARGHRHQQERENQGAPHLHLGHRPQARQEAEEGDEKDAREHVPQLAALEEVPPREV